MNIGEAIRKLRKEKGLTQKELAELSGLSEVSIINYEKGRRSPSAKILFQIAGGLKVPVEQLVGESEIPNTHDVFPDIGKRIKKRREQLGISLKELSDLVIIKEEVLNDFENGKTALEPDDIIYIAKLLDTSVQGLLSAEISESNAHSAVSSDNDRWAHISNFFNVIGYKIERELAINEDNGIEQKKELITKYKVITRNSTIIIDENDLERILNKIIETISFELWKIDSKEG